MAKHPCKSCAHASYLSSPHCKPKWAPTRESRKAIKTSLQPLCTTEPQYKPGEYVFLARSLLVEVKDQDLHQSVIDGTKNSCRAVKKHFASSTFSSRTASVEDYCIENTVTNDRVVHALTISRCPHIDCPQP